MSSQSELVNVGVNRAASGKVRKRKEGLCKWCDSAHGRAPAAAEVESPAPFLSELSRQSLPLSPGWEMASQGCCHSGTFLYLRPGLFSLPCMFEQIYKVSVGFIVL